MERDQINNFHSRSVWEFPNVFRPETRPGSSQSRMPVLSQDQEKDFPERSGREISQIFSGKIQVPGNGIRERRPLAAILKNIGQKTFHSHSHSHSF